LPNFVPSFLPLFPFLLCRDFLCIFATLNMNLLFLFLFLHWLKYLFVYGFPLCIEYECRFFHGSGSIHGVVGVHLRSVFCWENMVWTTTS
jgi:hypothetical protein